MGSSSSANKTPTRRRRKAKSICLPFESETHYQTCMADPAICRSYIMECYATHPELFPHALDGGFVFHAFVRSKKQGLLMRRIQLKNNREVYQLRPSFMMPYMIGRTEAVEKPLFLRRWGVPFEALSYVFGRPPMYWYRAYVSLGRPSLVGTTLKAAAQLPDHILADEKHSRHQGQRVYIPTTVGKDTILGVHLVDRADEDELKRGYGVFREEAQNLKADYRPQTVNTDGWHATRKAWKSLFPLITLILCFWHAVRKITVRCRRDKTLCHQLQDKAWHLYQAETLPQFAQRVRRLREWTLPQALADTVKEKLLELCAHASHFKSAYRQPGAYRTANALDRLMNYQDRLLYAMQYFHGTKKNATLYLRAMALVWNFHPYDLRTQQKYGEGTSPFERIHGWRYHDNWLENMMIAASMNGP